MTVTPVSTRTMNLAHLVEQNARRLANHFAFVWGAQRWTWAELDGRVKKMAAVFAAYGIEKGDRVLVQSRNNNQLFESMFACFRLGAVWVPANFRGAPDDLAWMAELSGAKLLLCDAGFPDHARIDGPEACIAIGKAGFAPDIDDLMEEQGGEIPPLAPVDRDDPCWFFFTSGTSGRPKASVLTHGQIGFVINNHLCDLVPATTHEDASLVVAPLSHGAGMHQLVMTARGAPTILTTGAKFDTGEVWSLVEQWRVTNIFTVPTILKMLVEAPEVATHDHSSLRYVIYAGAPMYRTDQIKALNVLGPVLVQYFGLGEVTGSITVLPRSEHSTGEEARIGTCGFPRTGMQVEIQAEDGTPCAPGETGEICVTGPAVFAGYWQNAKANEKSFRTGMFRTGDLGHMDEQGFLYITGRESDMYISGGSNIYPREIEEKLLQFPEISEAAVFGMPDEKWGEIGVAVVSPHAGVELSDAAVAGFLKGKIASYKMPKAFYVWDEIPKSGYGKMAKRLVRAELERRLAKGSA
ncbi:MAG: acyl-CoA synthetase [Alphaproteobacteria bacterium]|nr:MAG: acyl-CoA synthetase [Alphaproteobacteria bacterium]